MDLDLIAMQPLPLVDAERWTTLHASLTEEGDLATVPPVLADVVGRYAATTAHQVDALRTALAQGRAGQAAEILHRMRGTAAMLGAARGEQLARALEEALGRAGATAQALARVTELERCCAETAIELQHRLQVSRDLVARALPRQ